MRLLLLLLSSLFWWSNWPLLRETMLTGDREAKLKIETKSAPHTLPIYWINLDKQVVRRKHMESILARVGDAVAIQPVRVSAIDAKQVKSMLENDQLRLNGVRLVPNDNAEALWEKHLRHEYILEEAAIIMSHLSVIRQAFDAGHQVALVLEDDVSIDSDFILNWPSYASDAPRDWTLLQWSTSNGKVANHALQLSDPWISWLPDHYSAAAYTINREGMRRVLQHTQLNHANGSSVWYFDQPDMIVADEVIYYYAKSVYTATSPVVQFKVGLNETWRNSNGPTNQEKAAIMVNLKKPWNNITHRNERILVLVTIAMKTPASVASEFLRLESSIESLARWHENIKWVVHAIVTEEHHKHLFHQKMVASDISAGSRVKVHYNVMNGFVNKFRVAANLTSEMATYDYVLMIDSDMRLAGFPWNSFMEKVGGGGCRNQHSVASKHRRILSRVSHV